jgi:beta-lactamase regulating signal transducer with metallopeptidase domain
MIAVLIDLAWKSALISGLALLAGYALRRRAAGERVLLLRVAVGALLALPVFALAVPALEIGILPALETAPGAALAVSRIGDTQTALVKASAYSPADAAAILYGVGVALVVCRLLAGILTLRRWTRSAVPVADRHWLDATARAAATMRRPVRLLVSPHVAAPMSWGVAPAWLLIGPATEGCAEQAEAVIAHEMAHVRRLDWPMLVASRLATALFWFNPLVWLVGRELARQAELRADEDAVGHVAQADYAQTLLSVAGLAAHPAACGMAAPGTILARRIGRVLDNGPRPAASRLFCAVLLVCGTAAAAPLAAMKLVRAPTPPPVSLPVSPSIPPATEMSPPRTQERTYLPPIIPAARAADRPRTIRSRHVSVSVAKIVSPAVPASAAPSQEPESQPRTRPKPVTTELPSHVVAGRDARRASLDAAADVRRAERAARKIAAHGRRELAMGLSDSANDMRTSAEALERAVAKGRLPKPDQDAHMREARSLRVQADRLDAEARKLIAEL